MVGNCRLQCCCAYSAVVDRNVSVCEYAPAIRDARLAVAAGNRITRYSAIRHHHRGRVIDTKAASPCRADAAKAGGTSDDAYDLIPSNRTIENCQTPGLAVDTAAECATTALPENAITRAT